MSAVRVVCELSSAVPDVFELKSAGRVYARVHSGAQLSVVGVVAVVGVGVVVVVVGVGVVVVVVGVNVVVVVVGDGVVVVVVGVLLVVATNCPHVALHPFVNTGSTQRSQLRLLFGCPAITLSV